MEERDQLPPEFALGKAGSDWSNREVEQVIDWFATRFIEEAVWVAGFQLSRCGFGEMEIARDCVSEWLCGRVDSDQGLVEARIVRAIHNYDPEKGELIAFLMSDLRLYTSRTVVPRLRREAQRYVNQEIVLKDDSLGLVKKLALMDILREVLEKLNEKDRRLLLLVDQGYSVRAISEQISCSAGAVKTAICRARQHARDEFAKVMRGKD